MRIIYIFSLIRIFIKIETYWNVNRRQCAYFCAIFKIKIETYWNVNDLQKKLEDYEKEIKIETYWNVNEQWRDKPQSESALK